MAEKILNTRIILKHDDLANWNSSSLVLKTGEIALAKVSVKKTDPIKNTTIEVPTYLMKVGDGEKTFANLNWVAATAADVYDWAKKESLSADDLPEIPLAKIPEAVREAIDTDIDTQYSFTISEDGKLVIKSTTYNKGMAGSEQNVASLDFVTPSELDDIFVAKDYATKAEAKSYANAKDAAITAAQTTADNAAAAVETLKNTEVKANADAIALLDSNLKDGTVKVKSAEQADKATNADHATAASKVDNAITVKVGGKDVVFDGSAAQTADVDAAIAAGVAEAKKHADDNDANTEYHVEYDSTNKVIKLVAGADSSKMSIPTDDFIKDGMISSVTIDEATQELVITWNTDAGIDETRIKLAELCDIYTGVDGTTVKVEVSADDKISAEVKEGSIESKHLAAAAGILKAQLDKGVRDSLDLADSAVQEISTGSANGTISVDGTDVAIKGLGSMAYKTDTDYKKVQDTVEAIGSATKTISKITQDAQGKISVEYADIAIDAGQVDIKLPEYNVGLGDADGIWPGDGSGTTTDPYIYFTKDGATVNKIRFWNNTPSDITFGGTEDGQYLSIGVSYKSLHSDVAATAEANNQVSVLTGITQVDGKLTGKEEVKLAAIAKTGNVNDLIQTTGDVLVFDCGTSSVEK